MVRSLVPVVLLSTLACASARAPAIPPSPEAPPPASVPAPQPAPWQQPSVRASDVPAVYASEWRKAQNRETCALIAPVKVMGGATARAATFSGGWAVAYDTPSQRSAFGVAGTGSNASDPAYDEWPHHITWADGSSAGYGPEGGTGPNQLAYLRIAGQGCLYNVWSRLGIAHLETLLDGLRFVRMDN